MSHNFWGCLHLSALKTDNAVRWFHTCAVLLSIHTFKNWILWNAFHLWADEPLRR
jgi:hypothetical protein